MVARRQPQCTERQPKLRTDTNFLDYRPRSTGRIPRSPDPVSESRTVPQLPSPAESPLVGHPRDWTRHERARVAQLLHAEMATRDIAARLGVTPSTIRDYLSDPEGTKARARRTSKAPGQCARCGRETGPNRGSRVFLHCPACAASCRSRWTRESAIGAYHDWLARFSSEPTSTDWNRTAASRRGGQAVTRFTSGRWPTSSVIVRLFDNWAQFTAAARGAEPRLMD